MQRIRWFKVDWASKYNDIINAILSDTYSEEKDYGFRAFKKRVDFLNASYIHKREIEEKIENPLTNESTTYQRIIYDQTNFTLENNPLGIELINPTRNIQQILNTFALLSDFNISIQPLSLNLTNIMQAIKLEFDSIVIHQIECKDIMITENTAIKLVAKNDRSDVLSDIDNFLKDHKYTIEKIKCTFVLDDKSSTFELTKTGSIKTSQSNLKILLPIIKRAVLTQILTSL